MSSQAPDRVSGPDRILLERIEVFAHHGVLPEETRDGQVFFLTLEAELDLAEAARTDDLACTVSYAELAAEAAAVATTHRFALLEALAGAIAYAVLARFPPIAAITVRIDKPSAPMPVRLATTAVILTRRRVG